MKYKSYILLYSLLSGDVRRCKIFILYSMLYLLTFVATYLKMKDIIMKKGVFMALLLTVIIAFYSLYLVNDKCINKSKVSSLLLENIEALAVGEDGTDSGENEESRMRCSGVGTLDCPISHNKVKFIVSGYGL